MLVLSRQRDETIMIGDEVEVTVVDIRGDKVRLGISAPREVTVHRKEVYEAIKRENRAAAQVRPEDLADPAGGGGPGPKLVGGSVDPLGHAGHEANGERPALRPTVRATGPAALRRGVQATGGGSPNGARRNRGQRGPRPPEGSQPALPTEPVAPQHEAHAPDADPPAASQV